MGGLPLRSIHPRDSRQLLFQFLLVFLARHEAQRALDLLGEMEREGCVGHEAESEEEAGPG
jgi:hypothetical protein